MLGRSNLSGGSKINGIIEELIAAGGIKSGDFVKLAYNWIGEEKKLASSIGSVVTHTFKNKNEDNNTIMTLSSSNILAKITFTPDNIYTQSFNLTTRSNVTYQDFIKINEADFLFMFNTGKQLTIKLSTLDGGNFVDGNYVHVYIANTSYTTHTYNGGMFGIGNNKYVVYYTEQGQNPASSVLHMDVISVNEDKTLSLVKSNVVTSAVVKYAYVVPITNDRFLVTYDCSGTNIAIGKINNDVISLTNTSAIDISICYNPKIIRIFDSRYLLVYEYHKSGSNNPYCIRASIVNLNDDSMSVIPYFNLVTTSNGSTIRWDVVKVKNNNFSIIYYSDSNAYWNTYSIIEDEIIAIEERQIESIVSGYMRMTKLNENTIVTFFNVGNDSYVRLDGPESVQVATAKSGDIICGVAQSKGNSGDMVKVYVPNIEGE